MATETFTSSTTWNCPAGVTGVQAECYAAGQNGSDGIPGSIGGGGGGGGCYAKTLIIPVTPGNNYTITVGTSGFITTQFTGNSSVTCKATSSSGTCIGDTIFSGGTGSTGNINFGGCGGGAAGSSGNGGNATNPGGSPGTPGSGGTGNPGSGDGGEEGNAGANYGGGGGGGAPDGGLAGQGAGGYLILTYTSVVTKTASDTVSISITEGSVTVSGVISTLDTLSLTISDISNIVVGNLINVSDTVSITISEVINLVTNFSVVDTIGVRTLEGTVSISTKLAGYRGLAGLWLGGISASNRASGGERVATIIRYYRPVASIINGG